MSPQPLAVLGGGATARALRGWLAGTEGLPESGVIVDATGDGEPPLRAVERALGAGAIVVTSNPVLAGSHTSRLRPLAAAAGGLLCTRPALASVLRRPSSLGRLAATDRILRVDAVLSPPLQRLAGLLEGPGLPLDEAAARLPRARAELDGSASAARLALLAEAAFDERVGAGSVLTIGLERIAREEAHCSGDRRWRLVATAVRGQCARVEPRPLERQHPLARTDGYAPVLVTCERAGTVALEPAREDGAALALLRELEALAVRLTARRRGRSRTPELV